jgi:hypothetical protein
LIGYRALRLAGDARRLGLYGFGAAAHIIAQDGDEFLALAPRVPIRTQTASYPLASANEALDALRDGRIEGAAVLLPPHHTSTG